MRGLTAVGIVLALVASANAADKPLDSYYARLSADDHFNSSGERLSSAAAIVRQDRANVYVYGKRDSEDDLDEYFNSKANRARLEEMLSNGDFRSNAQRAIMNGTPLIYVEIFEDYVTVDVRGD